MIEIAGSQFSVHSGDTVCINPGTEYRTINNGTEPLKSFSVSSPPYQDEDTELLEDSKSS